MTRGIAPGLLGAAEGGALKPGRVSGTLRAPRRARVALYLKPDPAAPYRLDAAGFVTAADPDAKGRFAVAFSDGNGSGEKLSVSGNRGDLILDARTPSLDIPPLSIKLASR